MEAEVCKTHATFHGDAAASVQPRECVQSYSFMEICAHLVQNDSYRVSSGVANRLLHRCGDDSIAHTTLKSRTIAFGNAIASAYEDKARAILEGYGIDPVTGLVTERSSVPDTVTRPVLPDTHGMESASGIIEKYNAEKTNESEKISDAVLVRKVERSEARCCYVSIDDVGVKHQKESRGKNAVKDGKYVENTVIHIQSEDGQYTITAVGLRKAVTMLLAFLLSNGQLENRRLIFITDGATCIRDCLREVFGFREYTLILDWLHLDKKCGEFMSMAVKAAGKDAKKGMKRLLMRMLWAGNTDCAIGYLRSLGEANIKNQKTLDELVAYLERKKPYIHCYALRKLTGLRTSSNTVEKANDVNVAQRQKHNGMSWSKNGSGALAVISVASHNNELTDWIYNQTISFNIAS